MSFSLPDGQTVDIPSITRFAVADLCVGTTSSADEDANQKQASNNPREEAFSQLQNDFNSIVLAASAEENDQDMIRKWSEDDQKMIRKWLENYQKMIGNWSENDWKFSGKCS